MKPTSGTQFMLISVALAFLWAGMLPLVAQSQLALYDNFNSSRHIDPSKWGGFQFYDPDLREVVREVTGEDRSRRLHFSKSPIQPPLMTMVLAGAPSVSYFPDPVPLTRCRLTWLSIKLLQLVVTVTPLGKL